jgi:hypothetical protein
MNSSPREQFLICRERGSFIAEHDHFCIIRKTREPCGTSDKRGSLARMVSTVRSLKAGLMSEDARGGGKLDGWTREHLLGQGADVLVFVLLFSCHAR